MIHQASNILPHIFPIVGGIFSMLFMIVIILIIIRGVRHITVNDLFESGGGGTSITKFWQNVAYAAATIAFLAVNISGNLQGGSLEIVWLIYLGVVASNAVLSKWISVKYDRQQGHTYPPYGNRYHGQEWDAYHTPLYKSSEDEKKPAEAGLSRVDSPD